MHALDAQGWSYATEQTETKSELRGRDRGGNSLSAKQCWAGMYSRLFAHVTWLATDQRAVGHRWRGPERCTGRWICWERGTDEWKTRWAALIIDHFSCFAQFWFMCGRVDVGVDCWETHIFLEEIFQKVLVVFQKVCPCWWKVCGNLLMICFDCD